MRCCDDIMVVFDQISYWLCHVLLSSQRQYPNDVNSYILTGYTNDYSLLVSLCYFWSIRAVSDEVTNHSFSKPFLSQVPIFSIQTVAAPAALVHPSNSAGLALGCESSSNFNSFHSWLHSSETPFFLNSTSDLTNTNADGRKYLYSAASDYDQDVFDYDEENRGTITLGEALTAWVAE